MRRWKEEWTGRGREGSRVVGGGWGTSGKTWSQLIAPSFHGNARPFPPTPSLLSLSLFLSASSTPSLLSHFSFFSDFFSLLHFFLFQSVSVITLQPPRLLLLAHLPLFLFLLTPSSPPPGFPPSFPLSFPFLPFLSLTPNPLLTPFLVPSLVLVQFPTPLSPLTFAFMLSS